jgi:phosphoribosylformimino-5-aminoimidazole carboxamide ribotide isomerase
VELFPAIDVSGGLVARHAGERDPVVVAEAYAAQGARWLHVVDMDLAFATGRDNLNVIRRISSLPGVRVQAGGNLTSTAGVAAMAQAGVARVVLGLEALLDAPLMGALLKHVVPAEPGVAIEVRDGLPTRRGAREPVGVTAVELGRRARDQGIGTLVHRDLDRDGAFGGLDLPGAEVLREPGRRVIAAGGVAALAELVAARDRGLDGVIVGRAFHEGRFTVGEALKCLG